MGWACAGCGGGNPDGTRFCGHCGGRAGETEPSGGTGAPTAGVEGRVAEAIERYVAGSGEATPSDTDAAAAGRSSTERRLVTALFADVSGFTALADQVDEETLTEVIDPLISRFGAIVAKYEGYIGKYAGDAILALFGAPVSHEDDASRALMAAMEMHAALEAMRPSLPGRAAGLTLHVGVNSGYAVARAFGSRMRPDYSVLGDAVNLAQRLEAAAPGGQTYVGASTHGLTAHDFEFAELPPLRVKGKQEEVGAYRLIGSLATPGRRRRGWGMQGLVGREAELDRARQAVSATASGEGTVVAVVGEPGVGKSRLTDEVRRLASEQGAWWLEAPCLSYGSALAYRPFVELLRKALGLGLDLTDAEAAASLRTSLALAGVPELATYFGHLLGLSETRTPELADLEPEALRSRLHDSFVTWLSALSRMQPVYLVVEDLHWCDSSSLALLGQLASHCAGSRLGIWMTSRPEGSLAVDAISGDAVRIELGPLSVDGVGELIGQLTSIAPSEALTDAVVERSGGNPLFVEELVRSLVDEGAAVPAGSRLTLRPGWDPSAVPSTVEGVVAARIDLLSRGRAEILQTASVIGRRIRLPLLAAVLQATDHLGDLDLTAELENLVHAGFLDRLPVDGDYGFGFHHALVMDVAYNRLLRRHRRELHLRTAEVAERIYGAGDDTIDLLARHLYLGEAGERAVPYLERAARRSKALFANDVAVIHLRHAVDVIGRVDGSDDQLARVLLDLGDLLELSGDYEGAARVYEESRRLRGRVEAWRGLASVLRKQGRTSEAVALLDRALRACARTSQNPAPLWLERTATLAYSGRAPEALESAAFGLESVPDRNSPMAAHLLVRMARAEEPLGRVNEAVAHALEAEAIFDRVDDLRGLALARRVLGMLCWKQGRLDDAAATLRRGLELADRSGNPEETAACLVNLGLVELARGDARAGAACDERAIELLERAGHRSGLATAYANLGEKLLALGELDRAADYCDRALTLAAEVDALWIAADAHRTLARIYLASGSHRLAVAEADEAHRLFTEFGDPEGVEEALGLVAEALTAQGADELPS